MQKNWCTAKRLKSWARHFEVEREGAGTAEQEEASFTFDMEENEKLQLSSNNKPKNYILRLISIKTKKEALITILSFAVLIAVLVFPQTIPYYFILIFILIIGMRIYDIYQTIKQYKKTNKQERSSLLNDAKNSAVNEITFWS